MYKRRTKTDLVSNANRCNAMESRDHSNGANPKIHKSRGHFKLFILLGFIMLFGLGASAQDIIILKNGDEIKSLVQEIGVEYVKYKKFDNQSGPIYNVAITEIFMIKYQNGSKDVFNEVTKSVEPNKPTYQEEVAKPAERKTEQAERTYNNLSNDLKNEFEKIGTNDKLMLSFFERNHFTNYYNRFNNTCNQRNSGKKLLAAGLVLSAGGFVMVMCGTFIHSYNYYYGYYYYNDLYWLAITGYVVMGVGEVLTIVSIPVSASAGTKKKAIKNDFAREYFGINNYTYQPTLNLGITQSGGIGLMLNF